MFANVSRHVIVLLLRVLFRMQPQTVTSKVKSTKRSAVFNHALVGPIFVIGSCTVGLQQNIHT